MFQVAMGVPLRRSAHTLSYLRMCSTTHTSNPFSTPIYFPATLSISQEMRSLHSRDDSEEDNADEDDDGDDDGDDDVSRVYQVSPLSGRVTSPSLGISPSTGSSYFPFTSTPTSPCPSSRSFSVSSFSSFSSTAMPSGEVNLLSRMRQGEGEEYQEVKKKICGTVHTFHLKKVRVIADEVSTI